MSEPPRTNEPSRADEPTRVSLAEFLTELFETGRVGTPAPEAEPLFDAPADEALTRFDERARRFAPGEPPAFDPRAARWGAATLFRACQYLVDRSAAPDRIAAEFAARSPAEAPRPRSPVDPPAATDSTVWSVDLTLQYLPDLHLLARGLAIDDPLVVAIQRLAAEWPLSGVGVKAATAQAAGPPEDAALDAVFSHPTLRTLYVDRVIARRDRGRLEEPRTLTAVRAAVGMHPQLVPEWTAVLAPVDESRENETLAGRSENAPGD